MINMTWNKIIASAPPKNLWFESHGCMLHAHLWENSEDFTLVCIHGAIANNCWWQHIACQFDRGKILSVDLSGHGLSQWDSSYSLDKHAQEITTLLDEYAVGPVYIIGHSYGGAVAGLVAAQRPEVSAVMLDTPLHIALVYTEPSNKSYRPHTYDTPKKAVAHFKPIPSQPIIDSALMDIVAHASIVERDGQYTWRFDPSFHQREVSEKDQDLIHSALPRMQYWYGEHSVFATADMLQRAHDLGMDVCKIEGAYHAVPLDQPKILLEMMQHWVNGGV